MSDPYEVLEIVAGASEEEIRRAYKRAIRAHPPDSDTIGFARVMKAYREIQGGLPQQPGSNAGICPKVEVDRIRVLIREKQFAIASNAILGLLQAYPEDITLVAERGIVLVHCGLHEEAVGVLAPLVKNGLDRGRVWRALGLAYLRMEPPRNEMARLCFHKSLLKSPENTVVMGLIRDSFASDGNNELVQVWNDRIAEAKGLKGENRRPPPDEVVGEGTRSANHGVASFSNAVFASLANPSKKVPPKLLPSTPPLLPRIDFQIHSDGLAWIRVYVDGSAIVGMRESDGHVQGYFQTSPGAHVVAIRAQSHSVSETVMIRADEDVLISIRHASASGFQGRLNIARRPRADHVPPFQP